MNAEKQTSFSPAPKLSCPEIRMQKCHWVGMASVMTSDENINSIDDTSNEIQWNRIKSTKNNHYNLNIYNQY